MRSIFRSRVARSWIWVAPFSGTPNISSGAVRAWGACANAGVTAISAAHANQPENELRDMIVASLVTSKNDSHPRIRLDLMRALATGLVVGIDIPAPAGVDLGVETDARDGEIARQVLAFRLECRVRHTVEARIHAQARAGEHAAVGDVAIQPRVAEVPVEATSIAHAGGTERRVVRLRWRGETHRTALLRERVLRQVQVAHRDV